MKKGVFFAVVILILSACGKGQNDQNEATSDSVVQKKEALALMASLAEKKCLSTFTLSSEQEAKLSSNFKADYCACARTAILKQEAKFIATETVDESKLKNDVLGCVSKVTKIPLTILNAMLGM